MMPTGISLRLSVTDACQLRCRYCRPERDDATLHSGEFLETDELAALVQAMHRTAGIAKLRFTGGEALLRPDLPELVAACARLGIGDIALTTNAQHLDTHAAELKRSGLHRVNVSLDSLNAKTLASITRGGDLAASLAGIQAALAYDLRPVKLNMVVMRGINDHEVGDMLEYGLDTGCQIRFLELMPIGVARNAFDERLVPWRDIYNQVVEGRTFDPLPYTPGATSRDYAVQDGRGRTTVCGFISSSTLPFCNGCKRFRLTARGHLLGCLAHRSHIDLRPALRDALAGNDRTLASAISGAYAMKEHPHHLAGQREMAGIGG